MACGRRVLDCGRQKLELLRKVAGHKLAPTKKPND